MRKIIIIRDREVQEMAKRKINIITADKKVEIIKKWEKGIPVKALSKEYQVGQSTIYQ